MPPANQGHPMPENLDLALIRLFIRDRIIYYKYHNDIDDISFSTEIKTLLTCINKYYNDNINEFFRV